MKSFCSAAEKAHAEFCPLIWSAECLTDHWACRQRVGKIICEFQMETLGQRDPLSGPLLLVVGANVVLQNNTEFSFVRLVAFCQALV